MPAEWETHAATWFTWPRPGGISFPEKYETVPEVYSQLIRALLEVEAVHLNVWDSAMEEEVRRTLAPLAVPVSQVNFHHFPAYEPCGGVHGPIFIVREHGGKRERAIVDWAYNAWGN